MARKKTKSKATRKKPTVKKITGLSKKQKIVLGSFLFLLGLALLFSFISYFSTWQADQSILNDFGERDVRAQNWLNKFGAAIGHFFIYEGFGIPAFTLATLTATSGIFYIFDKSKKTLGNYWFWGILVMIWLAIVLGFFSSENPIIAGRVGVEMNDFLQDYLGFIGTILLLSFFAIAYIVMRWGITPDVMGSFFNKQKKDLASEFKIEETDEDERIPMEDTAFAKDNIEIVQTVEEELIESNNTDKVAENSSRMTINDRFKDENPDEMAMEIEETIEEEEVEENLSSKLVQDFGEFDPTLELSNYKFPSIELLKDYTQGQSITIDQQELEENKNRIVDTLKNYKIEIAHIKATVGPTVTLYEIVPEAGIRISKIKNLEDDIALSLSALGIRIIAPIPGKGTIGIEVPNKNARIVSMRSVIGSPKFQNAEMELPLSLGKTISNETFVVDLAKMPHLLMAGATGQGKSVGLNAILTSLLYKKHPAEVKFVLVDPKKVELTLFNKIERHYLAKLPDSEEAIITDNTKVVHTLNSLCIEMDRRYDLLKDAMVRNLKEYNAKFKKRKLNPNDGHKYLPYIILVVDEFADLIMTAGKEVETPIARLAQLARAIGIHLIIATQRPSVNVITGIIKANFPTRIAFRVTSKIDSRTILDSQGADQLIGRGDMLFTQGNDLVRVQCAFVDTPEVEKITDYIGSQKAYPTAHELPEYSGEEGGTALDIDASDRDALFKDAAEVIVTAQQGSASLLQRKLKLGYNRAGRIVDQLEAAGIVGPFEGSKARQVLVTDLAALDEHLKNQ
ncbi:MAG: DNA translocase FtsK 4TM domain-containing protein [Leeuwenhoekiella sp.]